jgi:hypothetical protein
MGGRYGLGVLARWRKGAREPTRRVLDGRDQRRKAFPIYQLNGFFSREVLGVRCEPSGRDDDHAVRFLRDHDPIHLTDDSDSDLGFSPLLALDEDRLSVLFQDEIDPAVRTPQQVFPDGISLPPARLAHERFESLPG